MLPSEWPFSLPTYGTYKASGLGQCLDAQTDPLHQQPTIRFIERGSVTIANRHDFKIARLEKKHGLLATTLTLMPTNDSNTAIKMVDGRGR
jgi:hypothetical protein